LENSNHLERYRQTIRRFSDRLSAMTAWMSYSNVLARLNLDQIEVGYANIF